MNPFRIEFQSKYDGQWYPSELNLEFEPDESSTPLSRQMLNFLVERKAANKNPPITIYDYRIFNTLTNTVYYLIPVSELNRLARKRRESVKRIQIGI